ncbi:hypothetical protein HYQ45_015224 [Verticillium longisporum]|uniref:Chromo domain-containing protein n=1 Tax=Verticillium longisporum TaxID=100787 RepID=A0A8I2Z934_VERLO|nr:hypothetical protein HYQ45_015224 [Verticillium longisporum]
MPSASPRVASPRRSPSETSDQQDDAVDAPSPSPDAEDSTMYMNGGHDFAESSPSADENNASDDADFDMEDDLPNVQSDGAVDALSSSNDSQRPSKRKAGVEVQEDLYIKANPELYGLRRSTRPREQRKIVDSDDSESDVPVNRRNVKRRRVETSQRSSKVNTPIRQASADDSDSDNYGGARAKTLVFFRAAVALRVGSSLLAEKRWSSRRAAQTVQQGGYEESDFEGEEDEAAQDAQYYAPEADNSPYIDKVLRHRLKDGLELSFESTRQDFEYYIKWQGKSHLHDTWETAQTLPLHPIRIRHPA